MPDAHAHRHFRTMGVEAEGDAITGRKLLMWNDDVEISLCRPTEPMDVLLPQRRGRRGHLRPRGLGHARDDLRRPPVQAPATTSSIPRGTTYRFAARGPAAPPRLRVTGPDRDPAPLPQRVRAAARARAVLPPRHPPADRAAHASRAAASSSSRCASSDGYQTYVLDYHPFDVVGWDGYVYPWTFSIHDFEPITGRIHMPPPSHQTFAGPQLRDLLVLPAQARLRPDGDPDPVPPLEPELGGDDLLRRRATSGRGRGSRSGR